MWAEWAADALSADLTSALQADAALSSNVVLRSWEEVVVADSLQQASPPCQCLVNNICLCPMDQFERANDLSMDPTGQISRVTCPIKFVCQAFLGRNESGHGLEGISNMPAKVMA